MSLFYFTDPDVAVRPSPTQYVVVQRTFNRYTIVDPGATFGAASVALTAQLLRQDGVVTNNVTYVQLRSADDYSSGGLVRTYSPFLLATLHRLGDSLVAVVDPSVGTFPQPGQVRAWRGISLEPQNSPTWSEDRMEAMEDRIATLFPSWYYRGINVIMGEVRPPDPAKFWTQLAKAVEVI